MINSGQIYWNDVYTLGHEQVDNEHKKLFDLSNTLLNSGNDRIKIIKSLKELIRYTKIHFTNEERYMESIGFTFLDEHKELHKKIVEKLDVQIKKVDEIPFEEFGKSLVMFINENIVNHILVEDKRVHHFKRDTDELRKLFQWKESYKIDNEQIDNEHQKLFELAMEALKSNKENRKTHIRETLLELNDYMKEHFKNEESYMLQINYKDYEEHKRSHEKIVEQMNKFIKQLPNLTLDQFERKLIEYMDVWLINHIVSEDQKIVSTS